MQQETAFIALTDAMGGARALLGDETRGPVLRRAALFVGKWLLGGVAVSGLLAMGEGSILGFGNAWRAYGVWWFLTPAIAAALPLAFLSARLAFEIVVLAVLLPVLWLGDVLGPWSGRALRLLVTVAVTGGCAWLVWMIGEAIATPPMHAAAAPASTAAGPPTHAHSLAAAWFHTYGFPIGAVFGGFLMRVLESLVPDWIMHKFKKRSVARKIVIWGADGRVAREVTHD